jgi:hypothetical protein
MESADQAEDDQAEVMGGGEIRLTGVQQVVGLRIGLDL